MVLLMSGTTAPATLVTLSSGVNYNNYTFRGDSTYYVTNAITLGGTATFEGGAVIKYAVGASLNLGNVNCQATAYHPVIFTAKDDNSVGNTISGSTGNPSGYYASTALSFYNSPPASWTMSYFRIAYAQQAITASSVSFSLQLFHGQLVNCANGIYVPGQGSVYLGNLLFATVQTAFNTPSYVNFLVENTTFTGTTGTTNHVPAFLGTSPGNNAPFGFYFENCIFANMSAFLIGPIGYDETIQGDVNGFYNNGVAPFGTTQIIATGNPFQAKGAGNYYLTDTGFRGVGSDNINGVLANDLLGKTTYPPANPPAYQYSGTTWNQLVPRNTCTPDLGYHYDPLDYLASQYAMYAAPVNLTGGVCVAMYGTSGFVMQGGGGINVAAQPAQMTHLVWYPSVQEQPVRLNNVSTAGSAVFSIASSSSPKIITLNSVALDMQGQVQPLFDQGYDYYFPILNMQKCTLREVALSVGNYINSSSPGPSVTLQNDLLERCTVGLFNGYYYYYYGTGQYVVLQSPLSVSFYNNLFWSNSIALSYMDSQATVHPNWFIKDNLYDGSAVSFSGDGNYNNYVALGHNANNNSTVAAPLNGVGDVALTALNYAPGPYGNRYVALATSASSSTALVDAGSRTAAAAGLSGYTMDPDQSVDIGTVDIGFHYKESAVRPGFYQGFLPANDDGSSGLIYLNWALNFFGTSYSSLYVNNNGNITFSGPLSIYTPSDLYSLNTDIIAPFWADVDTRACGSYVTTYGTGAVDGHTAFVVNWVNVGYYSIHADKLNSFQLVLINRSDIGAGDFDMEFNYNQVQWETGDASGGSDGLGGYPARVGYASYNGGATFELDGSGIPGSFLDSNQTEGLIYETFTGSQVPGRYLFQFRNGDWP
ncbi:MAG: nidogen-like domain-containing protein [Verrucomicrobiia bacterium]